MAIKKSELYSSLWESCDLLRGGMDASQYKDYVLVLLFLKYISDKYAGQPFAPIKIPPGSSFADMVALKGKPDIGERINKQIIQPLVDHNKSLNRTDLPDFDDGAKLGTGKEKVDRLTGLIAVFQTRELDFSKNRADGDDILGDGYEYLMRHFATESGKSKGQFYTPSEVSRIMAHVLGIHEAKTSKETTVYDPTCGSGSLLLKVGDAATTKVSLYGQEKDSATSGLARMNMILHDHPDAIIEQGNTLASPKFLTDAGELKAFDYVVANPPFSDKRWSSGLHPKEGGTESEDAAQTTKDYGRFTEFGTPPAKQGDFAYLLHIVKSLKSKGKGACILPHGVLFRGNAEGEIRKKLVRKGLIQGIIGLPANLFYGTGIPACIIVIDKEDAHTRKGIFMMDASSGFLKDGPKNRLRDQDIHKIVDTFTRRLDIPRYSRMVPLSEIEANDFNLNLPRYIDSTEPEDIQDIEAHLRGGIPRRDIDALGRFWKVFPGVRTALLKKADRPDYARLRLPIAEVKAAILGHQEFQAFNRSVTTLFHAWRDKHLPRLKGLKVGDKPKALIAELSESLLETFRPAPLLDAYDVYQHLMDLWSATMQDDVYLIVSDGWMEAAKPRLIEEDKDKKTKQTPDFTVGRLKYKAELIPIPLIVAKYFAAEAAAIEGLEAEVAGLEQRLEELTEEHSGEDGALAEALEDGKIPKGAVAALLKKSKPSVDASAERKVWEHYLDLTGQIADINKELKAARNDLEAKVAAQYGKLKEAGVKSLVVEDKWLATLSASVQAELDRVSQTLTARMRELAERYGTPLPQIEAELAELERKVAGHLEKMGFSL